MAGSYPNVPGRRMAWDADGTIAGVRNASLGSLFFEFSQAHKDDLNDEDENNISLSNLYTTIAAGNDAFVGFIFPELREVDGVFARSNVLNAWDDVGGSGDTTNLIDGSWSQIAADVTDTIANVIPNYRDQIVSTAASNRRGVRCWIRNAGNGHPDVRAVHIYGEIAAGETPDRLLWVDNATGSEFGLPIDYGDIPRGSASDREVKLRNNSGSLAASSIQVTAESLYLASGNWYTFKESGGSFQSTLPLASSIGAGADSPVLTIRRNTPDAETLGLHAARAYANVGAWS